MTVKNKKRNYVWNKKILRKRSLFLNKILSRKGSISSEITYRRIRYFQNVTRGGPFSAKIRMRVDDSPLYHQDLTMIADLASREHLRGKNVHCLEILISRNNYQLLMIFI